MIFPTNVVRSRCAPIAALVHLVVLCTCAVAQQRYAPQSFDNDSVQFPYDETFDSPPYGGLSRLPPSSYGDTFTPNSQPPTFRRVPSHVNNSASVHISRHPAKALQSLFEFNRIDLDGFFNDAFLEFQAYGDQVNESTQVFARLPDDTVQQLDGGGGYGELYFEQQEGQSFTDFIALIDGSWAFVVDFNGNFDPEVGPEVDDGLSSDNGFVLGTGLDSLVGFHHSGASADIENDGDLDVLLTDDVPFFLINDGAGNFAQDVSRLSGLNNGGFFTAELVDVDTDGFVDLLAAGTESGDNGLATQILWGDSTGVYTTETSTVIPAVADSGEVLDIDVADIDGDGDKDLVINRTGDGTGSLDYYHGYFVQVVEQTGDRQFEDKTAERLPTGQDATAEWFDWIRLQDFNGDSHVDIVVDDAARELIWLNDGSGNFSPADFLRAAEGHGAGAAAITAAELAPIAEEAIRRLADTGLTDSELSTLATTQIQIADLPDGILGLATTTGITIDLDAAGHGWYIDTTPADDLEFTRPVAATEVQADTGDAAGKMDLLSVLMHEMGHVLGKDHNHDTPHDLMLEELPDSTRRFPEWHEFYGVDDDLMDMLAHELASSRAAA